MAKLKPIRASWHAFGIQLHISPNRLKEFEVYTSNVGFYLSEVIRLWREMDPPPKIQHLINAVKYLDHRVLASKLDKDYEGKCVCLMSCGFSDWEYVPCSNNVHGFDIYVEFALIWCCGRQVD